MGQHCICDVLAQDNLVLSKKHIPRFCLTRTGVARVFVVPTPLTDDDDGGDDDGDGDDDDGDGAC